MMIFEDGGGGGVKFAVRVDMDDLVDGDIIALSPPPPLFAVVTRLVLLEPMLMVVLLFLEGTETCIPSMDDAAKSCSSIGSATRSLAVSSTALERALLNTSALTYPWPWHAPIAIYGVNFCTTT